MTPWSWEESNGRATAEQTQNFHRFLLGELTCEHFYADVWNDIVDKVAEMRSAIGSGWDTNQGGAKLYLSQSECYVVQGEPFRADVYNGVRFQVGSVPEHPTGINDRVPGDEIMGYHILHMADVLNDIINDL